MAETKRERMQREQDELDAALAAWIDSGRSKDSEFALWRAACQYLGRTELLR